MCLPSLRSLALRVDRRTLGAEELAGDVEGLAAHNDDLLAVKQLLSDGAGEATEQVALAVDDLENKSAKGSSACCDASKLSASSAVGDCQSARVQFRVFGRYVR